MSHGHGHAHVHAAREPVHAVADLASDGAPLFGGLALERIGPLEPCEVELEVLRGYALEAMHKVLETGVQAVDAVDGVLGRIRSFQLRAEAFEDGGVGPGLVGDDESALADAPVQHLVGAFLPEHAAPGHHEEGRARVVDAGDDAHLLLAQAALRGLLAALAGRSGHGALPISLVAVTEVRLVNLDAVAGHRVERGVVALDALDDAAAHEPCGTQTHSALVHAVAQRQLVYERLHVGHPRLHRQLGHAKHTADVDRERALAVLAVPALSTASRMSPADDADGAAPHASVGGQLLRARAEHILIHDGTQCLNRPAALVVIQQREPVPDPADQFCRLAPLAHDSIVITK